jgi:putative hydrolase of the HAD superfamily
LIVLLVASLMTMDVPGERLFVHLIRDDAPVIRAALFDLDGVIRTFDPAHPARVEAAAGLPSGTLHRVAFDAAQVTVAVDGRATFEQWRDAVAEALRKDYGVDGPAVAERFFTVESGSVDPEVLALVREVRSRVPVGLLTNATSRLASELDALALVDEIDVVCNSWELGVAKPDLRVFAVAAERMGVGVTECFFTDDRPENAEAAARAGMVAHHYRDAAHLRAALAPILERSPTDLR